MPSTVLVATTASRQAMGQQGYEAALLSHAASLSGDGLSVVPRAVRSLRSPLDGDVRLPMNLVLRSSAVARLAAAWAYRGVDLVHRCDLRLPPSHRPSREIVTVHDLAFEHFDDEGSVPPYAREAVSRSRAVIAPSEFSAAELRDRWGLKDVRAIHNGVDDVFRGPHERLRESDRAELGVPGPYVLHSGGCSTRKNLAALAQAWSRVALQLPVHHLVLAGPPDPRRTELFANAPRVVLAGMVPRELHVRLVMNADVVVVPSVYEGFGLPAAEALAAGTPVVAADRASLPEICGDAAYLVDPSGQELAAGLLRAVAEGRGSGRAVRGREWSARFTWPRSAQAHLDVYREVLESAR